MNTMTTDNKTPAGRRSRLRRALTGTAVAMLAVMGTSTWAQQQPAERPGWGARMQGGHGQGGMHDGAMFRGSPERMGRMIDRMLGGLDATDAQRAQIKQIAAAAAADLRSQKQAGRDLRSSAMQALLAPEVDANAVEQARQRMLQQHDQSSRRTSQAMIDIARVLTPEQRARASVKLQEMRSRMEQRRSRMDEHGRRSAPSR